MSQLAFQFKRRREKYIFKMTTIGMILATFDLPVTPMLLTKFRELAFWFRRRSKKIDFQDGGTILNIFDLQVTQMLPTKFPVNWPRGVGGVGFLSQG